MSITAYYLTYRFNQIPAGVFVEIVKLLPKGIQKCKAMRKAKTALGGRIGRLTLLDFNSYKANGNEDDVLASK